MNNTPNKKNSAPAASKKAAGKKDSLAQQNKKAQKIKHNYLRIFYYSFAVTFIIAGAAAILLFVYGQDRNFFGSADKCYDRAVELAEKMQTDKAIGELEECLTISKEHSKARLMLIDMLINKGDMAKAEALTDEGLELHTRNEKYYEYKISLLTKQNKISEALDFVNSVASNYIKLKLTGVRPANILTTPDPGTYDSAVQIRFSAQQNVDIYYTTDGSEPNLNSKRYSADNPIRIEKGTVTIKAFAINSAGLISDEYSTTYRIYSDYTAYTFVDAKIEQIVRKTLGKATGTIYYKDLDGIKRLSNEQRGDTEYIGQITSLADLSEMRNLTEICLDNEPAITDYTPLIQLKLLTSLSLNSNNIDDTLVKPIFSIQWLTSLDLGNNLISDVSAVKNMTLLKSLNLGGNALKDDSVTALGNLTNLRALDISRNLVSDVSPLASLTQLTTLNISNNLISDLAPLSSMTGITDLDISANAVKYLDAITGLRKIQTLNISNNPEISLLSPISKYELLTNLNISGTAVTSIAEIAELPSLVTLDCSRTAISDFSMIRQTGIKNLTAAQCNLTDISSLMGASVEVLDVSSNLLYDVTPFSVLPNLKVLVISSNPIYNISQLTLCPVLESVTCTNVTVQTADMWMLANANITVIQ